MAEKLCYICGAAGFNEVIITCMDCKSIFIHPYCMKSVEFTSDTWNHWICEDCPEIPKPGLDTYKGKDQTLTGEEQNGVSYLPNHRGAVATWEGCFDTSCLSAPVSPRVTVCGYPPKKVAKKAYEFSKKMSVVLPLEAIPRCTVWENLFKDGDPEKNDIGLFFFPKDDRSEQHYSCLVSHLEKQDIVLKSCISGIDLLIFSSSFLDETSKEINQACYLWGLFVDPGSTFKEPVQIQQRTRRSLRLRKT